MKTVHSLSDILNPLTQKEFIDSFFGKRYCYVPGWDGKFNDLLPWSELNNLLEQQRLDWPRLRLFKNGQNILADSFIKYVKDRQGMFTIPRIDSIALQKQLRLGATLIVDAVEEMFDPIKKLALALEEIFRERVQVNSYAGWHSAKGFNVHWDTHDVFILQIAGEKHWSVYGSTQEYPIKKGEEDIEPPTEPIWKGIMKAGDLLYMPRGCWHAAQALSGPTLHLTVGIANRTGLDIVTWMQTQLSKIPLFRKDLPRFSEQVEQKRHMMELKEVILSIWSENVLDNFLNANDVNNYSRPVFSLPEIVMENIYNLPDHIKLRKMSSRPINTKLSENEDIITVMSNNREYKFTRDAASIIDIFAKSKILSIAEICKLVEEKIESTIVKIFLGELIIEGFISVVK